MGNVRWSVWNRHGMITRGMNSLREVQKELQRREREAAKVMEETGAAHVIYGMKIYEEERLVAVHFYMEPMNEEEFHKTAGRVHNSLIYALHKR